MSLKRGEERSNSLRLETCDHIWGQDGKGRGAHNCSMMHSGRLDGVPEERMESN